MCLERHGRELVAIVPLIGRLMGTGYDESTEAPRSDGAQALHGEVRAHRL
jgi:hypothetical protein